MKVLSYLEFLLSKKLNHAISEKIYKSDSIKGQVISSKKGIRAMLFLGSFKFFPFEFSQNLAKFIDDFVAAIILSISDQISTQ